MTSSEAPHQDNPQREAKQKNNADLTNALLTSAAMKDDASPSNMPNNFTTKSNSPKWLTYAIASGVCAATNGVFAKLCVLPANGLKELVTEPSGKQEAHKKNRTTTTSTQTIATSLAYLLGFSHALGIVEVALRGVCLSQTYSTLSYLSLT